LIIGLIPTEPQFGELITGKFYATGIHSKTECAAGKGAAVDG
jgi:hypothetical protein